jgi:hypothetical protein
MAERIQAFITDKETLLRDVSTRQLRNAARMRSVYESGLVSVVASMRCRASR